MTVSVSPRVPEFNDELNSQLDQMSQQLTALLPEQNRQQAVMVGIHRGGFSVAQALHQRLGLAQPLGSLNISFYRDDFSRVGLQPQISPSELPVELDNQVIILVDDVLHSGRTIRAAMNELFDYGRPKRLVLAVLAERSDGRELPIQADVRGSVHHLSPTQHIKLRGEPLSLQLLEKKPST